MSRSYKKRTRNKSEVSPSYKARLKNSGKVVNDDEIPVSHLYTKKEDDYKPHYDRLENLRILRELLED